MVKYENINIKQLSELLSRNEATTGITVDLPELNDAMTLKKPLR